MDTRPNRDATSVGSPGLFAYLHGMASSALSTKGQLLHAALRDRDRVLELPDLNRPDFARLRVSSALEVFDELDAALANPRDASASHPEGRRWCLVGSSLGGYTAARWAQLNPGRVSRLVLLCPGFDMETWAPRAIGAEAMATWARDRALTMPDAEGVPVAVHYDFVTDMHSHPSFPEVPCPTLIIHGRQDEVVPIETSRAYAAERAHVEIRELDDTHSLAGSHAILVEEVLRFFSIL
jgi:uncharacterized protein